MAPRKQSALVRFMNMVQKSEDCWFWLGKMDPWGNGHFRNDEQKLCITRRFIYESHFALQLNQRQEVVHLCLSFGCVNPEHLIVIDRLGNDEELFWTRVDKSGGADACWPWQAGFSSKYGMFFYRGRNRGAHCIAWMFANSKSDLPKKPNVVMHSCDNSKCCNPKHLSLGTYSDNLNDCISKDRHPCMIRERIKGRFS